MQSSNSSHHLTRLQRTAMSIMAVMVVMTFLGANLHAVLWQSSQWLVSTVLPAVVVELTNEERADNAALPLSRNAVLDDAARRKAEHMAKNQYFAHFSPDGTSPWHWFEEAGYVYAHAGENLAIHFTDSAEIVEAWMNSPAHRKNIVDGNFTEIGVGTAKGEYEGYQTVYVVQLFGTPAIPRAIEAPVEQEPASVLALESPVLEDIEQGLAVQPVEVLGESVTESTSTSDFSSERSTSLAGGISEPQPLSVDREVIADEVASSVYKHEEQFSAKILPSQIGNETMVEKVGQSSPQDLVRHSEKTSDIGEVVVVQLPVMSTSSGLAVANLVTSNTGGEHAGATIASVATQPNFLLEIVYVFLGTLAAVLLIFSVALETRRLHYVQALYGVLLLVGMGMLWLAHGVLTGGAVIV